MPNFKFARVPRLDDPTELALWMEQQLQSLERAMSEGLTDIVLVELHVEPTRPRTGMIVLADGTDWDPGSGQGVYAYYDDAWNFLG
jgi:hypothetical protein